MQADYHRHERAVTTIMTYMKTVIDGFEADGLGHIRMAVGGALCRDVFYPVLKDFAEFANGNWDTAAIKTVLAMGVYLDDHAMFERALRYYVNGAGN